MFNYCVECPHIGSEACKTCMASKTIEQDVKLKREKNGAYLHEHLRRKNIKNKYSLEV